LSLDEDDNAFQVDRNIAESVLTENQYTEHGLNLEDLTQRVD
jgi:hypothetical protein